MMVVGERWIAFFHFIVVMVYCHFYSKSWCFGWHHEIWVPKPMPPQSAANRGTQKYFKYRVVDQREVTDLIQPKDLVDYLMTWRRDTFPNKSNTKQSLQRGRLMTFNETMEDSLAIANASIATLSLDQIAKHVITPSSRILPGTSILLIEQILQPDVYSTSVVKTMFTSPNIASVDLIYEDDHMALVNKPENVSTIDKSSPSSPDCDLQSMLGFLLCPSPHDPLYHPRPVHRLDRRTSGIVVVAKTQETMRNLSKAFASRSVTKTYTALVFGERGNKLAQPLLHDYESGKDRWTVVDYPIDKKDATSEVQIQSMVSVSSKTDSEERFLAMVQVRPKTGRTHQIRRHLSYCLGIPIVGDTKYDKGAKDLRTNGMFLCCHSLEFPCLESIKTTLPDGKFSIKRDSSKSSEGKSIFKVNITLPDKFRTRMEFQNGGEG